MERHTVRLTTSWQVGDGFQVYLMSFRGMGVDCDTSHCLVVVEGRERLAVIE
jgi:hypothetical protein